MQDFDETMERDRANWMPEWYAVRHIEKLCPIN